MKTKYAEIKIAKLQPPQKGSLLLFAENDSKGAKLSASAAQINADLGDALTSAIKFLEFKGKKGELVDLIAPAGGAYQRIYIAGLGKSAELSEEDWLNLGGKLYAKLDKKHDLTALLENANEESPLAPEHCAAFALGMILRSYKFDKYKTKTGEDDDKGKKKAAKKITIQCADNAKADKMFKQQKAIGEGVLLARDLVNEPANILGPEEFAVTAGALSELGVEVKILDDKAMAKEGMHALLGVGQGSAKPSRLAVMTWSGAKKKDAKPAIIVGKGVTFDTGGISLKPAGGMEDMKGDMGGAACVVGLMHVLAARKAQANVIGIIGLVENMPGSNAQRPGDIVTSMSGKTIEVLNTDAEGRLVLADALTYAQKYYEPEFIVNLATLTGAILVALGKEHAGLFSNSDMLSERLTAAGLETGEKLWRLPLGPKYDKLLDSKNADIKNIGGRLAGSITAAQFLQRFIEEVDWAHLDVAGTAMASPKNDINESWGSGFGVRLLDRLIANHYEN